LGNQTNSLTPPYIKQIKVLKADKIRRELITWSNGQTSERWFYHNLFLFNQPGVPDIYIVNPGNLAPGQAAFNPDYSLGDFAELSWISTRNYVGIQNFHQHICYVFASKAPSSPNFFPPQVTEPPSPSSTSLTRAGYGTAQTNTPLRAWVDEKTKLPVALENGASLQSYTFYESSGASIELPNNFYQALSRYQNALAEPDKYKTMKP
jgi:hypothetical protein